MFEALRQWTAPCGRTAPSRWWPARLLRELSRLLFEDKVGDALFRRLWEQRNVQQPMLAALRDPAGMGAFWCDNTHTPARETCDDTIGLAWRRAVADLDRRYGENPATWRWGRAHTARSEHKPFGKVPYLSSLFNLRVPTGGDDLYGGCGSQ